MAAVQFVTTDPVPMIAPTARIYAKTHGLAVLEWELSAAALEQQPVGSTDTYDFRVKDAGGNVIRSIENFSKFNFTKYKYYRLVWGGLTPGADLYTGASAASRRRIRRRFSIPSGLRLPLRPTRLPTSPDTSSIRTSRIFPEAVSPSMVPTASAWAARPIFRSG